MIEVPTHTIGYLIEHQNNNTYFVPLRILLVKEMIHHYSKFNKYTSSILSISEVHPTPTDRT